MTPASQIVERLGGAKAVADMLGLTRNGVQRWKYPAPRGHGNKVPQKHWAVLVEKSAGKVTLAELMTDGVAEIVALAAEKPKRRRAA